MKTEAGKILSRNELSHVGRNLNRTRDNFTVVKSAIDRKVKSRVPSGAQSRQDYTNDDLDYLIAALPDIAADVEQELCHE